GPPLILTGNSTAFGRIQSISMDTFRGRNFGREEVVNKKTGKKLLLSIAGILAFAVFTCAAILAAVAEDPVRLIVNGKTVQPDVSPQIMEGRVMVPVRWIAEALGAEVKWDKENRAV